MRNVINEYLSQFDLDVRKSHDARFVDQKCTPDIVCFMADCVMNMVATKPVFIKKPSPEPISPPPKDINYKRNKYIFSHYSFVHPIKPFVHPCLRHKFYFCHAIGTQLSEETPAFKI